MTGYRWNAHQGPDPAALHRLKEYFCIAQLEHWREALDGLQYHLDVDLAGALAQYDESAPCVIERWRLRG
jgi:hypothetical protein